MPEVDQFKENMFFKNLECGLERWFSGWKHLLLLQ